METRKPLWSITIGVGLAVILGSLFFFLAKWKGDGSQVRNQDSRSVAILNLGPHPLMETITFQCKKHLEEVEGRRISVRIFDANFQSEVLRASARQMLGGDYDVLVAVTTPAAQTLLGEAASSGKPIVFTFVSSPEALDIDKNNRELSVTGIVDDVPVKQNLELIRNLYGNGTKVGYLVNDGEASAAAAFEAAREAAPAVGIEIIKIPISSEGEVRPAADSMAREVGVFLMGPDTVATAAVDSLVPLSRDRGLPIHCMDPASVERGCLAAIAPDYTGMGTKTAEYVIKILEGTPPREIPIFAYSTALLYFNESLAESLSISPQAAAGEFAVEAVN